MLVAAFSWVRVNESWPISDFSSRVQIARIGAMNELSSAPALILLGLLFVLLFAVLIYVVQIAARLRRIENLILVESDRPLSRETVPSPAETSAGGAFEMFLDEEPARRMLSKSEQFAAYRQWRQEKGMNWSNS
jgi:hypothetical protein